jgi:hypothetical protein
LPEKFLDFYESNGRMVWKNKMKDWKACVRTRENRETSNNKNFRNWKEKMQYEKSESRQNFTFM